eukprot:2346175-Pyramimonas_sp.AAC.1
MRNFAGHGFLRPFGLNELSEPTGPMGPLGARHSIELLGPVGLESLQSSWPLLPTPARPAKLL